MQRAPTVTGAPALAAESVAQTVYPRLDRTTFSQFIRPLKLDEEQRMIAEMLFSDYSSSVGELMARTGQRADEAGQRRVDEALSGRRRISPEELRDNLSLIDDASMCLLPITNGKASHNSLRSLFSRVVP